MRGCATQTLAMRRCAYGSSAPTRSTAIGWSVSGTGVNGTGMAICAAMAMIALPAMTSATFVSAWPRITRSFRTVGIDGFIVHPSSFIVQNQDRRQQGDGGKSAQPDPESRSIPNRSQTRIVRDGERSVADDRRERSHDDGLSRFMRVVAERRRLLGVSLQHVNRV